MLDGRPFRGTAAIAGGLLTRRQLNGPQWRRILPDVYAHREVELDELVRCHAAGLWLDGRGAVSGLSAAHVWGAPTAGGPVEVTVPVRRRVRDQPGIVVVRSPLSAGEVTEPAGFPMTVPSRTMFDIARRAPRVEAVVALDALLGRATLTVADVVAHARSAHRWPGAARAIALLADVEPLAESAMETRCRLVIVDAGLPRPVAQYEVRNALGRVVARVDLAYPERKVGIEYEGDHHRGRAAFQRDLQRMNLLRSLGWTVLRFGPEDVLRQPERLVQLVRQTITGT